MPSHIGIAGNEKSRQDSYRGIQFRTICRAYTLYRLSTKLKYKLEYIKKLWQSEWDENVDNKLRKIQPLVGKQQPKLSSIRDDMVIRRTRIGHTYLTHKCLMVKEDQPFCNACNELLTVNIY